MRSGIVLDFCKSLLYLALKKKKRKLASYALYIQTVLITHIVHLWKTLQ